MKNEKEILHARKRETEILKESTVHENKKLNEKLNGQINDLSTQKMKIDDLQARIAHLEEDLHQRDA